MRKFCAFLSGMLCLAATSFAQITFDGSSSAITTPVNSPAVVVDNTLTIASSVSFDAAKVSVSTNFNSGDVLSYNSTLPSGMTAGYDAATGILTFSGMATPAEYQALLRTVTFQTSSTNAAQRTILFNLGSATAFSGTNHFYEFIPGSYSWTSAKSAADSKTLYGLTGYLATITSQAENDFVQQKTGADGWIGGSDDYVYINAAKGTSYTVQSQTEGQFFWVTGPEKGQAISTGNAPSAVTAVGSAYMNWNSGEPNNYNGTNENFIEIYSSGSFPGRWNDLPNSSLLGYVVEYGGMAGDPVVDLTHSRPVTLIATALRTTGTSNNYALKAPAVVVDASLLLYSSASITNATVTISTNFKAGDVLAYTGSLPAGVTGGYNTTTGVLSFSGTATAASWQALLRTVTFNSTSTTIGDRTISFSVGNLISGSNGHFYEFVSTGATWTAAKATAAAKTYLGLQGYMVTITSQTENDFVQQKLSADGYMGASDDYALINTATGKTTSTGYASQTASEGKWYWVTGPEAGTQITTGNAASSTSLPPVYGTAYNNWNTGEPNNSSANENYGQIYSTGVNPGKWNDLSGASSLGYVVEYGGLSTDPLLELSASRTLAINTVLPVNGLRFSADEQTGAVLVKWSTEMEEKTIRFDVMYSTDGRSFSRIGTLDAAQNSSSRKEYSFIHNGVGAGAHYYKLLIVDRDGETTASDIKLVRIRGKIGVQPNPASVQISVSNPFTGAATVVVKNALGAIVRQQPTGSSTTTVNIQSLAAGVYFVQVLQGNATSDVVQLLKK